MERVVDYQDRYRGATGIVIGKGPTRFRYENLHSFTGPAFFINDAVQFENHAHNAVERFFFAHDVAQACWLTRELQSVAVLPAASAVSSSGKPLLSVQTLPSLNAKRVAVYEWLPSWRGDSNDAARLRSQEMITNTNALYYNTGTIHSVIHFAWWCGIRHLLFVGCSGFHRDGKFYDDRIDVKSGGQPIGVFGMIRKKQDWMCETLGVQQEHVNEPRCDLGAPRICHFVWLGADVPGWVEDNVELFRSKHESWRTILHRGPPADMPPDLVHIANQVTQYCTQKDLISYWLLYSQGGLFLDCDMITVRNMDPLLRYDAFACREANGRVNCAAMGAKKGSLGMARVLAQVRKVAAEGGEQRTKYGPLMLTKMFGRTGDGVSDFSILPTHYFFPLVNHNAAHPWWKGTEQVREALMLERSASWTDSTRPYAVHLWGVGGSSHRAQCGHGDAVRDRLLARFNGQPVIRGAEVGVFAGRLSKHLLEHVPTLDLLMVDQWRQADQDSLYAESSGETGAKTNEQMAVLQENAKVKTAFAANRRRLLKSDSVTAAKRIEDGTLDFVFIDGDHTYEGVKRDIAAWYPKVRVGGLVSGHDIDSPLGRGMWGVRQAVEEHLAAYAPKATLEVGNNYTWFFTKPEG